jgi:processive 1,2-diacylglycerol beta-glucosyltransferase
MSKVLLLTAGYGEGHNAAARGLHAALTEAGADAEIVDFFALTEGAFYEQTRRGYIDLINRAPKLWAAIYGLIDKVPTGAMSVPFLGRMQRAMADMFAEKKPAAVISVYPIYGYLVDSLYPQGTARPFAFHTVVTDSITINSIWHRCHSDTFLVPNEETAAVMIHAGVPENRLHVFGFPVPPRFARERPARPAPAPPRVLYMINAGKEQAPSIVARLLKIDPLHLTVTVGRDEMLRAKVEEAAAQAGRPVEIHGWTPHMPELLMTHHVLIGKAGGATVQETIAAGTPMLMTQVVPGQEEGNAELLFQNHCGALCPTADDLAAKIEQLFRDNAAEWRAWEQNISRLSRPDAALQMARFILNAAPPASER